jgi:hypothetical protein
LSPKKIKGETVTILLLRLNSRSMILFSRSFVIEALTSVMISIFAIDELNLEDVCVPAASGGGA